MKIGKEIFKMKLKDVVRIGNNRNHRISINFMNYKMANDFVKN